jgi:hypothetical protein
MPLEGHYQKVNTPLRKLTGRELAVLIAVLAVTAIAVVALLFAPAHSERQLIRASGQSGRCIEVFVAGRVGSEPVVGCGAKARQICARAARYDAPRSRTIVEACRRAGIG